MFIQSHVFLELLNFVECQIHPNLADKNMNETDKKESTQ